MSKSFLQSSKWAEFQESFGRKTFRIEKKLVIKYPLPLGLSYFYCPRSYFEDEKLLKDFLHEAQKIARKENAIFLRIEPDVNSNFTLQILNQITKSNFKIVKNMQPQDSLILDLGHTEETLLENMHSKSRYNIRLSEKHGIKIIKSTDIKDVDVFYNLAIKTSARDGFSYHKRSYYDKMLNVLGKDKTIELFIAYHGNLPTAAILIMFYKDTAIYLHGASDHKYRNLMSPYLLQWEAIKEAKKRGCKTYDFWGIAPKENIENHPWSGITRFKMGFAPNGDIVHYPGAFDLIYQPFWYKIYTLIRKK